MATEKTHAEKKELITRAMAVRTIASSSDVEILKGFLMHDNVHPRKAAIYKLTKKLGIPLTDIRDHLLRACTDGAGRVDDFKVKTILGKSGIVGETLEALFASKEEAT